MLFVGQPPAFITEKKLLHFDSWQLLAATAARSIVGSFEIFRLQLKQRA